MALTVSDSARDRARTLRVPDAPKQPSILSKLFRPNPEMAKKRKEKRKEFQQESKRLARVRYNRDRKIYAETRNYKSKMERRLTQHQGKPYRYLPSDVKKLLREANVNESQWDAQSKAADRKVQEHFNAQRRVQLRKSEKQLDQDRDVLNKKLAGKYGLAA